MIHTSRLQLLFVYAATFLVCVSATALLMPGRAHAATLSVVTATTTTNNASTTLAKIGNTVTFGLQLSGTPSATTTPVINIFSMGSTSMSGSGAFWSYSTTSASSWINGFLTFSLAWGGSLGESTTTVTQTALTGPNVRFDSVAPTISSITSSAACSRSGGTLCIVGDTIIFTLTPGSTEYGASVSGSYNAKPLTWSTSNAGATYTATYTVGGSDATQTSPLQISGVVITDAAGNASGAGSGSDVSVKINGGSGGGIPVTTVVVSCPDGTFYTFTDSTTSTLCPTASSKPTSSSPTAPATTTPPATLSQDVAPAARLYTRDLTVGASGNDVHALQLFLIAHGTGSAAKALQANGASNFFGRLTKAALAEYQKATGIHPAAGYFGRTTRGRVGTP